MGCFLLGLLIIAVFVAACMGIAWLLITLVAWVAEKNTSYPIIGKVGAGLCYTALAVAGLAIGIAAHGIGCQLRGHNTPQHEMSMNQ